MSLSQVHNHRRFSFFSDYNNNRPPSPFNQLTSYAMSQSAAAAISTLRTVTIPYSDLKHIIVINMVVYGEDEIAFQIGETTEILSRGYLRAIPHCVQAPKGGKASGVDRSTFALFMQPDWDEMLDFPEDMHIHKELKLANCSIKFGEYSEKLLDKYYFSKT